MPRETVRTTTDAEANVQVGWSPQGSLQVATEFNDDLDIFRHLLGQTDEQRLYLIDQLRRVYATADPKDPGVDDHLIKQVFATLAHVANGPTTRGYQGVWATLDRGATNRLIKTLRRARDSAYGRDE